jgi:nuclear GTP-binding protein
MWERAKGPARIDPNRKWFGNVRTIDQEKLEKFRTELAKRVNDPRSVLIKAKTLPLSLLVEPEAKNNNLNILDIESYKDTFGPQSKRKRVKLMAENMEEMMQEVEKKDYDVRKDERLDKHKVSRYNIFSVMWISILVSTGDSWQDRVRESGKNSTR